MTIPIRRRRRRLGTTLALTIAPLGVGMPTPATGMQVIQAPEATLASHADDELALRKAATSAAVEIPAALASQILDTIAARWEMPASRIHIEWRALPTNVSLDDATLSLALGSTGGHWTIVTRDAKGTLTRLFLRAGTRERVTVSTRPITRGLLLGAEDIRDSTVITWGKPGPVSRPTVGWVARRAISAGEALREPTVGRPPLVVDGDTVSVIFRTGDIQVGMKAVALDAGALGERVTVQLTNGRRTSGIVMARKVVNASIEKPSKKE